MFHGAKSTALKTKLYLAGLHQLRTLTLSNNNLRRLTADTFKGLTALSVLDISGNRDCEFDARMFNYIVSIQELNLRDMNIRKVDKDMFKNLKRLRVLKLHMNNLEKIHQNVILNLPSLETLDLNGNLLRGIPSELQPKFQAMNQVHFSENPLQCNCQLLWIRLLSERFYDSSSVVCCGPSKLRYSAFGNVPDSDFICIPPKVVSCKAPHEKIGQRLTIECEYEGDPIPEIKWQRPGGHPIDGREFSDGQYQITENGTLIITSVADIDVGDWTVTAYNKTVSDEHRVSLYVDKTTTPPSTSALMPMFMTSALTELPTSNTNVQEASNIMSKLKWGLVATGAVAVAGGVAVLIKCYKKKLVCNSKVGENL